MIELYTNTLVKEDEQVDFASIIANIGATPGKIFVGQTINIPDNLTIPLNVELQFIPGGKFVVAANKTLTINNFGYRGNYSVFDTTAIGSSVVLPNCGNGLFKNIDGVWSTITDNSSNWNTAYGWGNHASPGYYVGTSSTIRGLLSSSATGLTYTSATGIFSLTAGYVIPSTTDISNGNTAFSWGNHAGLYTNLQSVTPGTQQTGNINISGKTITNSLQVSGLTTGRVPYMTTAGLFTDQATFAFDGTNLVLPIGADIRPSSDSTTAINIANAAGTNILTVDTINKCLYTGGAFQCGPTSNLYGSTSAYISFVIGKTTGADGDNGGLYAIARYTKTNIPFTGLCGWDRGTSRDLYFGGGAWQSPDCTRIYFYTAPTAAETINAGVLRMSILEDGYVNMQNLNCGNASASMLKTVSAHITTSDAGSGIKTPLMISGGNTSTGDGVGLMLNYGYGNNTNYLGKWMSCLIGSYQFNPADYGCNFVVQVNKGLSISDMITVLDVRYSLAYLYTNNFTITSSTADTDITCSFVGTTNSGTLKFMEDEKRFDFNSPLAITSIKSGATQAAAGAAVNEIWKTSGHATLPDNVLLIGV